MSSETSHLIKRRVSVIAAHPDDEVLGCGGTLVHHVRRGDRVRCVIACAPGVDRALHQEQIRAQTERARRILGIEDVTFLNFPDQRLDTLTLCDIITPLEAHIQEFQPHVVYCQYGGDVNRDHQVLFEAVKVATRPTESCIESVLAFDTASSTEWAYPRSFIPDTWIDISTTLTQKLEAMACYENELRPYPHPRSIEALRNRAYAWGNQCCLEAAEVFLTIRRLSRDGQTLP